MDLIFGAITFLSLLIWIVLMFFRGQFWRCDQKLGLNSFHPDPFNLDQNSIQKSIQKSIQDSIQNNAQFNQKAYPSICAVIPARNEAELLPITLKSLLSQTYPGDFSIVLVDDNSTDQTSEIAQNLAQSVQTPHQLTVISAKPLQPGWSGKLWAIHQGIEFIKQSPQQPDYLLLTDADIEHDLDNISQLVTKAERDNLDLVSLMVLLRCKSIWEKLLIPAFVFFFQKLYPFPWVNDLQQKTAAAAGGCILIRHQALEEIGGIASVKQALIDDCTLAQAVKSRPNPSGIWLGLTQSTHSLRAYPSLESIWDMVARTAFTQLNYSPILLLGTVLGMAVIYLMPVLGLILGVATGNTIILFISTVTLGLMIVAYLPTLKLYQCSPFLAVCLPLIALLYLLMTLDSAIRHWQGKGGLWKGRIYSSSPS
ncbi:MAG: glycosyltransferase [Microcoleaceae cyanobacterium]